MYYTQFSIFIPKISVKITIGEKEFNIELNNKHRNHKKTKLYVYYSTLIM